MGREYEWYSYSISCAEDYEKPDHAVAVLCLRNIHARRLSEENNKAALWDSLRLAEQANMAKREFLSNMTHEIRTPLNAIIGMTQIAKRQPDFSHALLCLDKIELSSKYLLDLVNDILDFSRIESKKNIVVKSRFRLSAMIREMVEMTEQQAALKQQRLHIAQRTPDYLVDADRICIMKILLNIAFNAVKYTEPNGEITIDISEKYRDEATSVIRFVIRDTGIGMSEEVLERLYEPFVQGDVSQKVRKAGSGLGMAICKSLSDAIGAAIAVRSKLGEGTEFTVDIPVEICGLCGEGALPACEEKEPELIELSGRRVLLVEDNAMNAEIGTALLEMQGLTVELAEDGRQAVERFLKQPQGYYDVILMDIQMPVLDGMQVTKEIRNADRPDGAWIPIIAMTANAFQEDVTKALSGGMNDYITKPIDMRKLMAAIREHIKVNQG